MDGLGHGPDAHEATSAAIAAIAETPDAPLPSLFECCNKALQRTGGFKEIAPYCANPIAGALYMELEL